MEKQEGRRVPIGRKKPCTDHAGNAYPSFPEMCAAYGQAPSTVRNRMGRGWTLEQALSVDHKGNHPKVNRQKPIQDHLGNWYGCVRELAEAYGITEKIYWSRKRICKWPLEKILTTPVNELPPNAVTVTDHLGQEFPSVSHMCRHWKIGLSTYRERMKRGWDVQSALTGKKKMAGVPESIPCTDHTGKAYASKAAMCAAWGKTRHCVQSRLDLGWTLERALTEPFTVNARPSTDHMGREYPTAKDMANYLGFPGYTLQSVKDTAAAVPKLAAKYWTNRRLDSLRVIRCINFPWFLVSSTDGKAVVHFEKVLEAWHQDQAFRPLATENRRIQVIRALGHPWYLVQFDGHPVILNYWRLIELNAETNFGISVPDGAPGDPKRRKT